MFNKIILHGRLVRDPESFATTGGVNICKFTVANSRKFKEKEDVIFIECKVFGNKGDACSRFLKKGSECIVAGILTTEKWTGKDGEEKQKNSILAEEVEFIGRPPQQAKQPPAYQQRQPLAQPVQAAITEAIKQQEEQQQLDTIGDDIPF